MKILFFGDIFGSPGRAALKGVLPGLRNDFQADTVIANVENLAHGKGITPDTVKEVLDMGVDIMTSGNHVWEGKDVRLMLEDKRIPLVRPANYPSGLPGRGYAVFPVRTQKIGVVNMMGRVFMRQNTEDPFHMMDRIIDEIKEETNIIFVDFHAEATSEKVAFGWYVNGRVSVVAGTHTHVPTLDLCILSEGTAYVTDVGMVGPRDSVIGKDITLSIQHFLTQLPTKLEVADGPVVVNGIYADIDNKTGKAKEVERIQKVVEHI